MLTKTDEVTHNIKSLDTIHEVCPFVHVLNRVRLHSLAAEVDVDLRRIDIEHHDSLHVPHAPKQHLEKMLSHEPKIVAKKAKSTGGKTHHKIVNARYSDESNGLLRVSISLCDLPEKS